MTTILSNAARSAGMDAVNALLNGGGTIEVRTGAQPAGPDSAATGTLLATLTFSATAFGAASNGVATANSITGDSSADASGDAGWFRLKASGGAGVIDGSITVTAGGGDAEMANISIVAGGTVTMSSLTVTLPSN